jgi:hypothetical protein
MKLILNMVEIKGKETLPPIPADLVSEDIFFAVRQADGSITLHRGHFHLNNCFYAYTPYLGGSALVAQGPPFGTDSAAPPSSIPYVPPATAWMFVEDIKEE